MNSTTPLAKSPSSLRRPGLGCLFAFTSVVAGLAFAGYAHYHVSVRQEQERVRIEAQRIAESLAEIRQGRTDATIYSSEWIEALANDQECVANVQSIDFFITNLGDPKYARVTELTNVESIFIYDCGELETFLKSLRGMPSLKKINFEATSVSDEMIRLLGTFPNLEEVHFERYLDQNHLDLLAKTLPDVKVTYVDNQTDEIIQLMSPQP